MAEGVGNEFRFDAEPAPHSDAMAFRVCERMRATFGVSRIAGMDNGLSEGAGVLAEQAAQESVRLVEAIASGDREAELEFVRRFQPRVKAMLLARTRNTDASADLLQDVIIEAICALRKGQLREPSKLTAFVLGIARNLLRGYFRGLVRRPEPLEFPDLLPDRSPSAVQFEERRESSAMQAIASLEVLDRTILHLTLVEGLKPGAIAEKLRLSPDVVRQRKLRATRRVMDLVRGQSQKPSAIHIVPGRKR
jgi:RNA polymerase sigma factor (sigma-70 family)